MGYLGIVMKENSCDLDLMEAIVSMRLKDSHFLLTQLYFCKIYNSKYGLCHVLCHSPPARRLHQEVD